MADVTVNTTRVELRTCRLTKSILRQMRILPFGKIRDLCDDEGNLLPQTIEGLSAGTGVVGWVHGTVLDDERDTWLIIRSGDGTYGRFNATASHRDKFPQIFIV